MSNRAAYVERLDSYTNVLHSKKMLWQWYIKLLFDISVTNTTILIWCKVF